MKTICIISFVLFLSSMGSSSDKGKIKVGSKKFTESVILSEAATLLLNGEIPTVHRKELGGTRVLWSALKSGAIDIYPEYTGTIKQEILNKKDIKDFSALQKALADLGIGMTASLGFNNTYALGIKSDGAKSMGLSTISDLKKFPNLRFGFSNEFLDRADGWPGLQKHYGLPQKKVFGMDHDLAYKAMDSGKIDVTDLYSTDAEIDYHHLTTLQDDRGYFPDYQAVFLYRLDLAQRVPRAIEILKRFEDQISEREMIRMNAQAKIKKIPELTIASEFVNNHFNAQTNVKAETPTQRILKLTYEHLFMVCLSLLAAILIAIPLGIICAKFEKLGQIVLAVNGIIQTIPSLALLVFLIPFFGIGSPTAMIALFLYSILPILRNTATGFQGIPRHIQESAQVLGLSPWARLRLVELPLAARSILAGIKTSAVINVGTATLGAIIGAGGYGQPILTGIRLDDTNLILQGAIPAAVMALLVQFIFERLEKFFVVEGA